MNNYKLQKYKQKTLWSDHEIYQDYDEMFRVNKCIHKEVDGDHMGSFQAIFNKWYKSYPDI